METKFINIDPGDPPDPADIEKHHLKTASEQASLKDKEVGSATNEDKDDNKQDMRNEELVEQPTSSDEHQSTIEIRKCGC